MHQAAEVVVGHGAQRLEDGAAAGGDAHAHCIPLTSTYLNYRKTTIYGGSNEVQRNIVAQTLLG